MLLNVEHRRVALLSLHYIDKSSDYWIGIEKEEIEKGSYQGTLYLSVKVECPPVIPPLFDLKALPRVSAERVTAALHIL
jgi:hypothetical protein